MNKKIEIKNHIVVFKDKKIRRVLHEDAWWFVVTDVVTALTDTVDASQYVKKMRSRDEELSKGWEQFVIPLLVETEGGKQKLSCANTEGVFRIIQSKKTRQRSSYSFYVKLYMSDNCPNCYFNSFYGINN